MIEDKRDFAKNLLEDEMFMEIIRDVRNSVSTKILNSDPVATAEREQLYNVWIGCQAFVSQLQSLKDDVDNDDREFETKEDLARKAEMLDKMREDALKDL